MNQFPHMHMFYDLDHCEIYVPEYNAHVPIKMKHYNNAPYIIFESIFKTCSCTYEVSSHLHPVIIQKIKPPKSPRNSMIYNHNKQKV